MARPAAGSSLSKMDPVVFEILRHRLWSINDEQAVIAARMSGSPIVYEAFDFNCALVSHRAEGLFVGVYLARHAATIDLIVRYVLEHFQENPGIHPGDMFVTNDPWVGPVHQSDYCVVAPVFAGERIVMWTGMTMHEHDVGGPVPGNMSVGAKDCFGEAPIVPPMKIVERGKIRKDIEDAVLRNSRTPYSNGLNLRARIGCQKVSHRRLGDLIDQYGVETFLDVQEAVIEYVAGSLEKRLKKIPDGTWEEHGYVDHDGNREGLYDIHVKLIKRGGRITLDFDGTSPQVEGGINCTWCGLIGGIMSAVFPMLCFDLPWSTGGILRVLDIQSKPGTLNNAEYPAACSMGTIQGCWETTDIVGQAIAKMLASCDDLRDEVQACWSPSSNCMIMNGLDREGKPFTGLWLGGMAGGAGARSWNDGIDTAGFMPQTRIAAPNVETCERLYPILEVYRKECPDTAGYGKYRGGIGMEHMIIPYKTPEDLTVIRYSHAVRTPEGRGISGGYPAPVNVQLIYRNTDIRSLMASGKIPRSPEDISHESFEDIIPKSITHMGPDDVRVFYVSGGGGYGDPLDRPIHLLEKDLREGLCSPQTTNTVYGAVLDDTGLHIDEKATLGRRRELKQLRIESGAPTAKRFSLPFPDGVSKKSRLRKTGRIGEHLAIERKSGRLLIGCVQCGHVYGPADQDPKIQSFMRETPVTESHWINALSGSAEVCLREYFCPACGTLFSVNVQRKSDPLLIDMRLA